MAEVGGEILHRMMGPGILALPTLVLWPWEDYFNFLCLTFHICIMRIMIVAISEGCWED